MGNDRILRLKLISAAVASCFASGTALANPTGANVVHGTAAIHQAGNLLQITNSPNAIINWQSFSIGASEITRFIQQSPASAVLNRVTTQNPSSILGALQSNGRVFLINPNGILIGAGAQIDVAGLVASTLSMSNDDFLAGRMRFTDGLGNSVINQGNIGTPAGGSVYLVGPSVRNEGLITSPQGEVVLAAGNSVELVNPGTPNLRVEITAPDNEALNLGRIVADAGRIGIYAGLISQSGTVRADSAVVTEDGRIVLKATRGVTLESGSMTAASGAKGGNVTVETETGTLRVAGSIDATGSEAGGSISLGVTGATGGIDLGTGLRSGNASVSISGPGATTTLNADIITAGADITINDSVVLGAPASITLDTTDGGSVAAGANITITGTVNDDVAGSTGLALSAGSAGANTLGGAVGDIAPIATLTTSGSATVINGGSIATTGNQTYNGPVTLTADTTLATGSSGTLTVNRALSAGANALVVDAGNIAIHANVTSGTQTLTAAGDITIGAGSNSVTVHADGPQTIHAGGSLVVQGAASGANRFARVRSAAGQNITAANVIIKGGSGGTNNFADILQQGAGSNQSITVTGGGTLSMQGGLGGADNFARIRNDGVDQLIAFPAGGAIVMTGGNGPDVPPDPLDTANNFARIENRSLTGMQTIDTGTIELNGGLSGANNFTGIQAAHQAITTTGDATLQGGPASNSGSRIGAVADTSATDLTLDVGGNLTLNGGSGADSTLGSNRAGGQTTDIAITVAGDITLNGGGGAGGARIGSPDSNVTGGSISITSTVGNISLHAGSSIRTLGEIEIHTPGILSLTGGTGADLGAQIVGGGNQVVVANSIVLTAGAGTNNLAEIYQTGATGSQTIDAASISIAGGSGGPGNLARIRNDGTGPQTITGSPTITLTGGTDGEPGQGNFAQIRAAGPQTITAGTTSLTAGVSGVNNFASIQSPTQVITVHGDLTLTGGGSTSNAVTDGAARIGGLGGTVTSPTSLTLTVDGDVAMTGGSVANAGAVIGSGFTGGQPTDITMNVGGNLTLGTGTAEQSSSRIGSPSTSVAGGDISISVGGNITLDSATVTGTRSVIRTLDSLTLAANNITVGGSLISGAQTINAAGDITVAAPNAVNAVVTATGPQTISAGGALTVQGGVGTGLSASITGSAGQTISASSINVVGGSGGANSFAEVLAPSGTQTITGTPAITLTGGSDGTNNFARIRADAGPQSITAGNTTLTAGEGGVINFSVFQAPAQAITVHGDLTLTGRGSSPTASSGGGARIGGVGSTTPTNLVLNVDGDITLNGGSVSGATLGSNLLGGQPTDIAINAGGSVTLNPGTGGSSRIGSPAGSVAGGNISITSGGEIALNSVSGIGTSIRTLGNVALQANAVAQGNDSVIQASQLTTATRAGTNLGGNNQVARFKASNFLSGQVVFNNTSPLLTVAGINAIPGSLMINQTGDLAVTGNVVSGPQLFAVSGDMVVGANSNSVVLAGLGSIDITARSLALRGGSEFGAFSMIVGGPINVTTTGGPGTGDFSIAGGSGPLAFGWVLSTQDINLTIGGNLTLDSGTGLLSFARMQTLSPTSVINAHFPNLSSGGYFVNGVEGAYSDGLNGFFSGLAPAKPGERLITTYGQ